MSKRIGHTSECFLDACGKHDVSSLELVNKLLESMQSKTPCPAWVDGMQEALKQYKFDEVEVSSLHEAVSALAVRYDGAGAVASGIRRRAGSVAGLRPTYVKGQGAKSLSSEFESLESRELQDEAPDQDTTECGDAPTLSFDPHVPIDGPAG